MWSEVSLAGHPVYLYEPAQRNPHGFVLIYLHGVHLNRLHDKGWFLNPRNKAKSVVLTEEGEALAQALFDKHFGKPA